MLRLILFFTTLLLLNACKSSSSSDAAPAASPSPNQPSDAPTLAMTQSLSRQQQLLLRGTASAAEGRTIDSVHVEINGIAQTVHGGAFWAVNSLPLTPGAHRVTAQALDSDGVSSPLFDTQVEVLPIETTSICSSYAEPQLTGQQPASVTENSGLIVSAFDAQVVWSHNDSGGQAEIFAVAADGTELARITLNGVTARDFEDSAAGPCFDGDNARSCLYIGDIGDNASVYDSIRIHRLVEPNPFDGDQTVAVETMEAVYADGPHDAEAMLVDNHGTVFIISKESLRFRVYGAAFFPDTDSPATLAFYSEGSAMDEEGGPSLAGSRADFLTAADYDPLRHRVALRGYYGAYEYRLPESATPGDLGHHQFRVIPAQNIATEGVVESIAYGPNGYWLSAENDTEAANLYRVVCDP